MASLPNQEFGLTLARIASELNAIAGVVPSAQSLGREPESASGKLSAAELAMDNATSPVSDRIEASKLASAQARYDERRKRDAIFGHPELFGEPAWDILLDLYIAQAKGVEVSVSSACIGSAAPPTTGLRWLGLLQETGLVTRSHDAKDQRRILVRLSPEGIARMESFLALTTKSQGNSILPLGETTRNLEDPPAFPE